MTQMMGAAAKAQSKKQRAFDKMVEEYGNSSARLPSDPAKRAQMLADADKFFEVSGIKPGKGNITIDENGNEDRSQYKPYTDEEKFYGFARWCTHNRTGLLTEHEIDGLGGDEFLDRAKKYMPGSDIQPNRKTAAALSAAGTGQTTVNGVRPDGSNAPQPPQDNSATKPESETKMPAFVEKTMNFLQNSSPLGKVLGGAAVMFVVSMVTPIIGMLPGKAGAAIGTVGKLGGMSIIAQGAGELFGFDLAGMVKGWFGGDDEKPKTTPPAPTQPQAPGPVTNEFDQILGAAPAKPAPSQDVSSTQTRKTTPVTDEQAAELAALRQSDVKMVQTTGAASLQSPLKNRTSKSSETDLVLPS